jgi:hypothetical protein
MQSLHVITTLFNPLRYQSRVKNYFEFANHIARFGIDLWTVEIAFGDRHHEVTESRNPRHVQLRTNSELWHKETANNIGAQHLTRMHPDWQYVCCADADVHFCRDDWHEETVEQLQHYAVLQPWSEALDTGPEGTVLRVMPSFGFGHVNGLQNPGKPRPKPVKDYHDRPKTALPTRELAKHPERYTIEGWHHPGLAWAYRREAWDQLGGLFDESIVGHADTIMALAMVGEVEQAGLTGCHQSMYDSINHWARRAQQLRQNIGYIDGSIMHRFHGSKRQRQYGNRRSILADVTFDPKRYMHRDAQGLFTLDEDCDQFPILRDRLRKFFRARNEDGSEV